MRAFIERNAIALLSTIPGCPDIPSPTWLGLYCPHRDISESGLWNSHYVRDMYSPDFLARMRIWIEMQEGETV